MFHDRHEPVRNRISRYTAWGHKRPTEHLPALLLREMAESPARFLARSIRPSHGEAHRARGGSHRSEISATAPRPIELEHQPGVEMEVYPTYAQFQQEPEEGVAPMKYIAHRVNTLADLRSLPREYGGEIDLRDRGERLILQHDPFKDGGGFAAV